MILVHVLLFSYLVAGRFQIQIKRHKIGDWYHLTQIVCSAKIIGTQHHRIIKDFIREKDCRRRLNATEPTKQHRIRKVLGQIIAGYLISNNMLPFTNAVRSEGNPQSIKTCMHKTFWFLPFITWYYTLLCWVEKQKFCQRPQKCSIWASLHGSVDLFDVWGMKKKFLE